ncbi:ABC transporter permease [uncultured Bacteroides sp.]|uniref:ABC transporter permease n=1 Tax=uncultured Bacteroides sp. TaxID=162156 RepID=UPI002AAB839D|nr:FtsX-like permease family protein [uncultured Bacteroides sp.]
MYKQYLKQAWQLLKQNKLFSSIYIIGTGLAISMVMIMAIVYYIKIANIYPETNRDRMLVAKSLSERSKSNSSFTNSSSFSYSAVKEYFYSLKSAEAVTAVFTAYGSVPYIQLSDNKTRIPVQVQYTDNAYWKVFNFSFVDGKPYSQSDFISGIHTMVISESMAKNIFGSANAIGKILTMDFTEYRISGVVRDASYATPETFAQAWVPYTCRDDYKSGFNGISGLLGGMKVYILCHSSSEAYKISKEVSDKFQRYTNSQKKVCIELTGQPELYWKSIFRTWSNVAQDWKEIIKSYFLLLMLFLMVPAINLSSMISSRMNERASEIGVRKAFGAPGHSLLNQILFENLILTCLGGIAGLLFSYILILLGHNWLLNIFDAWTSPLPEGVDVEFSPSMLINPTVFVITFIVCLVLNLLSAILPAWISLRKNIIDSLNAKN